MATEAPTVAPTLICFTNCLLATEDGEFVRRDLWICEKSGTILDAQKTFFERRTRPTKVVDLGGNILAPGFLDVQINGAYGFDFSVYDGDDGEYVKGLEKVAGRIVETGVTSLVPTLITQEKSLYPQLLSLLRPRTNIEKRHAHLLGWHAEGPFLQPLKRGAHQIEYIIEKVDSIQDVLDVYGPALSSSPPSDPNSDIFIKLITMAPELPSDLGVFSTLTSPEYGVTISIGHSIASSDIALRAVKEGGARMITHLFNAMPVLHHRDPGIIGLLGADMDGDDDEEEGETPLPPSSIDVGNSVSAVAAASATPAAAVSPFPLVKPEHIRSTSDAFPSGSGLGEASESGPVYPRFKKSVEDEARAQRHGMVGEALGELPTPPRSPDLPALSGGAAKSSQQGGKTKTKVDRPFYGIIVDGVHSHPNSVRIAYGAHPEGCVLITDAMMITDPHLKDGTYPWRDGRKIVKEGVKLYLEGSDTLAGSVVTMDICVRNFARFTRCGLAKAIKCATYNPARCLKIEDKKGTLRPGAHADLVVLDHKGFVKGSWIRGKEAWSASKA